MPPQSEKYNLLLIEDDPVHADLVRLSIEECGSGRTIVSHVSDGLEAWEYLQKCVELREFACPSIIVLDVRMPRMDGIEFLKRVKSHEALRMIPAIVLTTSSNDADRDRAYSNHANSFLTKPVDFEQFQSLVQELEHYWTRSNQPPPMVEEHRFTRAV